MATRTWRGRGAGAVIALAVMNLMSGCDAPGGGGGSIADVGFEATTPDDTGATTPGDVDASALADTSPVEVGPAVVPGGPRVLSLSTNVNRIKQYGAVVFSAVVTDPDGIDDLIGGTLRDPTTGNTYATFATAATEGAYQLSLTWGEMHTVSPIEFAHEATRVFQAEFFDQAGHKTVAEIGVALHCDGEPACDGACGYERCNGACNQVYAYNVDHRNCGGCGNVCPGEQGCSSGECACLFGESACGDACVNTDNDPAHCGGCGSICATGLCTGGVCACNVYTPCAGDELCMRAPDATREQCYTPGDVRLTGGGAISGNVEIEIDPGTWVPVCLPATGFASTGLVVCREIFGAAGGNTIAGDADVGDGILIECTGSEGALSACTFTAQRCSTQLFVFCDPY